MQAIHYALAFAAGVTSHLVYFHQGEHHMYGLRYVGAFMSISAASIVALHSGFAYDISPAIRIVAASQLSFLAGLYSSLLAYRAFFNPLNKFPGPLAAKMTRFWWCAHIGASSHAFLRSQELHKKYGPFVRIGPNDLSIAVPDGPELLYGHGSKCRKADWYDGDAPLTSMHTSRDRGLHDRRRRIWSPAFSDKALRGYETRIKPYGDQLLRRIEGYKGKPIDVANEFNFFGYDVMGDLAFGKDFGMLQSGEEHFAVQLLNEGMQPMALMLPTWFFRILASIPGLSAGYRQLQERIKTKASQPDLMTPLVEPYEDGKKKPKGLELSYLMADSRLVIVAGSDTTSATLVYIFYHLAQQPDVIVKARKELETLLREDGTLDSKAANSAEYVTGIINEALRMHPPVPTALQRLTPPEGLQIGNTYVPGNTVVWCPQYVLGRSEEAYVEPNSFIPERWSTKPELIKNKGAFFPFSLGGMGCIGKPLAMLELRIVMAKLLLSFDVSFAPNETGKDLIEKCRDHFTIETGPLNLVFKERKV